MTYLAKMANGVEHRNYRGRKTGFHPPSNTNESDSCKEIGSFELSVKPSFCDRPVIDQRVFFPTWLRRLRRRAALFCYGMVINSWYGLDDHNESHVT